MQTQQIVHNGHTIVIRREKGQTHLTIDDEHVPIRSVGGGFIATFHSPYLKHNSVAELAMHVVDHVINKRVR